MRTLRVIATDPARSALMRRVRRARTAPEEAVAAVLRALGIPYRRNVRTLPGSPDFANLTRGFAIFVNGCFWHRHDGCARATTPKANAAFWTAKLAANVARDAAKTKALRAMGLRVIVIWECETKDVATMRRKMRPLSRRERRVTRSRGR